MFMSMLDSNRKSLMLWFKFCQVKNVCVPWKLAKWDAHASNSWAQSLEKSKSMCTHTRIYNCCPNNDFQIARGKISTVTRFYSLTLTNKQSRLIQFLYQLSLTQVIFFHSSLLHLQFRYVCIVQSVSLAMKGRELCVSRCFVQVNEKVLKWMMPNFSSLHTKKYRVL